MFAVRVKIYGVLYNQASSIAFDETSSYWSALKPLATDHILMQPQALSKTMVTKALNTLSNVFRLKVDKSNTFQFHILPLYDEYIHIQNHKVLKR